MATNIGMAVPGASPLAGGAGLGDQVAGLTQEEIERRKRLKLQQQQLPGGGSAPGSALASGYGALFGGLG
jgi:hypothetical protein